MELIIAELSRYVLIILFAFIPYSASGLFPERRRREKMPYGMPRGRSRF